jgi:hypothetical protein
MKDPNFVMFLSMWFLIASLVSLRFLQNDFVHGILFGVSFGLTILVIRLKSANVRGD